jgi:calcium-dependent protein kinase
MQSVASAKSPNGALALDQRFDFLSLQGRDQESAVITKETVVSPPISLVPCPGPIDADSLESLPDRLSLEPLDECEFEVQCEEFGSLYRLGNALGHPGAFGSAWDVYDVHNGDRLLAAKALKIPIPSSSSAKEIRALRKLHANEVSIVKRLSQHPHRHVMKVERVVHTPTHLYIVSERYGGGDLFDRVVERGGRVPELECRTLFRQLLLAAHHLHTVVGVTHCDLKLSNVLLSDSSPDAIVKVIDFGLSRKLRHNKYLTAKSGTSSFMAPEQIRGRYTESADMFSLGVILFILAFGFNPFDPFCSRSNAEIELQVLNGFDPVVRKGHGAFFPASRPASSVVCDIITRLLRSDPVSRLTADQALGHPWFQMTPDMMIAPPSSKQTRGRTRQQSVPAKN